MRVLFLSLCAMEDMESQGIYSDLLKEFRAHGHDVLAIAPRERRTGLPTELANCGGIDVLRVAVGNIQKTNLIEKGVSTLALTREFLAALDKRTPGREFDLVIYATPPTTISGLVEAVKKRTGAKAYLLLKDIFPQNSLDLGMLSEGGVKGLVYRYFKVTERKTYEAADWIGCMSPANREYLLAHEPWLDPTRVEVNPNTVAPRDMSGLDAGAFRAKYGLPNDERIFAYGGNLGKPQCVDFLIDVLRLNEAEAVGFFVIAGSGTDRPKLERFFAEARPRHAALLPNLPRDEYDAMLCACDVGLIILDPRFTIPNFPSRVLSYMQAGLPILTATDATCDMGRIAEANGFGVAGSSASPEGFLGKCRALTDGEVAAMGRRSREYLDENYTAERSYELIMEHFNG